ncbi:MAG: secondary thiamine-phosphate synthase enzyme YjbQ [Bryobacterales bacterium]|nr:secondary thiamine-phosphate synthase enzyme YjbQ [Bryobacterales bacterium]
MRQQLHTIRIRTTGPNLYEFTDQAIRWLKETGIERGLLTVYVRHTSASLVIQENADPDVRRDLVAFFRRLVPDGDPLFVHTIEGPDDMPAHAKAALTQVSLSIPVADGLPVLGAWQGLYLFEHRRAPHTRNVVLHVMGE